jgi:hypothetical protein
MLRANASKFSEETERSAPSSRAVVASVVCEGEGGAGRESIHIW